MDQSVDSEDTRSALTVGDGFLVPQNMHKLKFYMKRIIGDDGPFFYDEEFLNDQNVLDNRKHVCYTQTVLVELVQLKQKGVVVCLFWM